MAFWTFWLSVFFVLYAYFGYPLVLAAMGRRRSRDDSDWRVAPDDPLPNITVLIPAHNEEVVIEEKIRNTVALNYPSNKLQILIISDGSTDRTCEIVRSFPALQNLCLVEIPKRGGKANALNIGLEHATGEIIVFSDSSIIMEKDSFLHLVKPFRVPEIGCVSGEDHIAEAGGEGAYGKYELYLRNLESQVYSIVGASGSIYAQRKRLCVPFPEGVAPDFFSVLTAVEHGYRAVTEPHAAGHMKSLEAPSQEFNRKVRTLVRGMAAIFLMKHMLNPLKYGAFSLMLLSHKLARWLVPFFLVSAFLSSGSLAGESFYLSVFGLQCVFYGLAAISMPRGSIFRDHMIGKIPLYFVTVNAAIMAAWFKFLTGFRQELWEPTRRNA